MSDSRYFINLGRGRKLNAIIIKNIFFFKFETDDPNTAKLNHSSALQKLFFTFQRLMHL